MSTTVTISETSTTVTISSDSPNATQLYGVTLSAAVSNAGEIYRYDGSNLVPYDIDAAIASQDTLAEMNDVTITGPADNDLLQYDSGTGMWVDRTLSEAGIQPLDSDLTTVAGLGSANQVLITNAGATAVAWSDNLDLPGTLDVTGAAHFESYLDIEEIAEPGAASASHARLFAVDDNGFSTISHIDPDGFVKQMGRDSIEVVRNNTGATISKGEWVYISGSTGTVPTIALAQADSPSTMPVAGVVIADIGNNSFGRIMLLGDLDSVDTSGFNDGDSMYVSDSVAGGITSTVPTGSSITQRVGVVVKGGSVGGGVIAVTIGAEFDPSTTDTFTNKTIGDDLDHDGSAIGFFGTAPAAQAAAYSPTNVSTDRAYDANATTVDELADVLGTLIADLQSYGLLQ